VVREILRWSRGSEGLDTLLKGHANPESARRLVGGFVAAVFHLTGQSVRVQLMYGYTPASGGDTLLQLESTTFPSGAADTTLLTVVETGAVFVLDDASITYLRTLEWSRDPPAASATFQLAVRQSNKRWSLDLTRRELKEGAIHIPTPEAIERISARARQAHGMEALPLPHGADLSLALISVARAARVSVEVSRGVATAVGVARHSAHRRLLSPRLFAPTAVDGLGPGR
jgi:hypothetical protein